MGFIPAHPDPDEEYGSDLADANELLYARLMKAGDIVGCRMLHHLMGHVYHEAGAKNETIRNLAREVDDLSRPRGVVFNGRGATRVWWDGKQIQYEFLSIDEQIASGK